MEMKFYLDTSIWMDLYEDRKGFNNEPLGDYAWALVAYIMKQDYKIVISDIVIKELLKKYPLQAVNGMMKPFEKIIIKIISTPKQIREAELMSKQILVPKLDVLHALIARDNNLILITRDNHFWKLDYIAKHYKPEEIVI